MIRGVGNFLGAVDGHGGDDGSDGIGDWLGGSIYDTGLPIGGSYGDGPSGPSGGGGGGSTPPSGNNDGTWGHSNNGNLLNGGAPVAIDSNALSQLLELPDEHGFYPSRIAALEVYLQANPTGLLDCDMINAHPNLVQVLQEIGSYEPPVSVLNHIDNIRDQNSPFYSDNNFYIQKVEDGNGVVNCDYFPVTISQLPIINGTQLSPLQFLEYFRKNINSFISATQNKSFSAYYDNGYPNYYVNESSLWNQDEAQSLGSLVHIHMLDDGTVVESDYHINNVHNFFIFTTMATPNWADGTHPVAGNRRFGIFSSGTGYVFYISGVDRCYGSIVNFANEISGGAGFADADALWNNIQQNMKQFINTHGGNASLYSQPYETIRPNWQGVVKQFLQKQITLQQLKDALHCP